AQYVGMASTLYGAEPVVRQAIDECAEIARPLLPRDLREVMFASSATDAAAAEAALKQTLFTQPALFTVGYALARLWESWGVRPRAFLGHSVGEIVLAALAGVFSVEDAVRVVT